MRRNTSQHEFRGLVNAARAAIPQLRVTTDVIVGFPGETAAEFDQSERFIRELDFGGLARLSLQQSARYASQPHAIPDHEGR